MTPDRSLALAVVAAFLAGGGAGGLLMAARLWGDSLHLRRQVESMGRRLLHADDRAEYWRQLAGRRQVDAAAWKWQADRLEEEHQCEGRKRRGHLLDAAMGDRRN